MGAQNIIILLVNIVLLTLTIVFHYLGYKKSSDSLKDYKSGMGLYFFLSKLSCFTGGFFTYSWARIFFDVESGRVVPCITLVVFIATYIFVYMHFRDKVKQNESAKG